MSSLDVGIVSVVPSPYQRDLFRAIAARSDCQLSVYYLEKAAPDSPWPEKPLESYETVLPGFWFSVAGARFHCVTRAPVLKRHKIVILNSLTSSLAQFCLHRRRRDRALIFWGESLREQPGKLRRVIQGLLTAPLTNANAIVAIGSRAMQSYQNRFPRVPVFNIPYHCDLQPFLERNSELPNLQPETIFLFCGQMIYRKGVDLLIQAFDRVVSRGFKARLVLAGREAELSSMLQQVSAKTKAQIEYIGFIDPSQLSSVFARAHVFVLPSRHDGWGVVVNQALGAGLPIICSDAVGAGADLVVPDSNGFCVPAGEVEPLAVAMESLARDPCLLRRMGAASRRRALDWTPARGAEKWVQLLQRIT
jgi:glycosyltransferase involved in cell wall biosynthesis